MINKGIGLSVPAFFSTSFIDGLKKLEHEKNGSDYIDNVYGSPRSLILGQARASNKIPELSLSELRDYINNLHKIGLKFHFTLNNVWSNSIEKKPTHKEKILREINDILETGVDALIIGNLYLNEIVKKKFSGINTICSINLKTDSVYKLKSLINDFEFNKVVLERTTNRNITFLKNINSVYSNNIVLLANPDCIYDCPLSLYHMLENGQQSMQQTELLDKDYCINYCHNKYMDKAEEVLKTPWIYPADIDLYEQVGVRFLKIQGRTLSEERILRLAEVYLNRIETSSFLDIFPNFIRDKKNTDTFRIFNNDFFNRRAFVESFFNEEINCKNICGLKCFKCDNIVSKIKYDVT